VVTLKAKGETWVEVTDSKGVVQVRKILAAGEVASASGAMPLSVVIGRADMTSVEVRGQAFSLDAISKDNVARFEVK
jgi:cytoskeleton protein RodZ